MASSSSSSSSCLGLEIKHDVFISFRGTDTRRGFVSHLWNALDRKGIDAYVDDKLESGDEISPALLRAIEESQISLIVFSKDFASSKWCLEELVRMMECRKRNGQIVMPIFYDIDPSDVRHQKRSYGEAFTRHETRYKDDTESVQSWRTALKSAADLSGFHSSKFGTEVELIENIVERVLKSLNNLHQSGDLKDLIGIQERIAHVESLLRNGSEEDVRVIGIWGMGGIGKTTLAAAVYNRLCSEYESCCFLANVREELEKHGIVHLRNKLVSTLLEERELHFDMPNGIPHHVMRRLRRCRKVLLVLDDVNDSDLFRDLAGGHNWFRPGSKIIVTTRDKHLLREEADDVYEVEALDYVESLQLFNLYAFRQSCPTMEYSELSEKVVNYAQGIPLALKVLGSFLYGRSIEEWESELKKLRNMPFKKIQDVLRLSYNGLDSEEQTIFLYIACFFQGSISNIDRIKILLDACGYSATIGLQVLQEKAMITIIEGNVSMHDLMQEIGWEIARESPRKHRWLWDHNDIYQVLKYNSGPEAVESISLNLLKIKELHLSPQAFAKMYNLKFLNFYTDNHQFNIYLPEGLDSLPEELRLLQWDDYPSKSLPLAFCAENLVELRMQNSRVEKLWDGVHNHVNLNKIDLSWSRHLIELPNLTKAINLKYVHLQGCTSLSHVDPSILSLRKLAFLDLAMCTNLKSLQSHSHSRSLKRLLLKGCSRLKEFSVTSDEMYRLDLASTALNELPSSVGCLRKLDDLSFQSNQFLKLSDDCEQLDGLVSLTKLYLGGLRNSTELPHNIGFLSSLQQLSLKGSNFESLPTTIKHLSQLKSLVIRFCQRLQSLPELPPSVKHLDATECRSLEKMSTSSFELLEGYKRPSEETFSFDNCMKLDGHTVSIIMAYAHVRIKQAADEFLSKITIEDGDPYLDVNRAFSICLPGSQVPNWFSYRTTEASVTIELPPSSKFMSFAFSLVVNQFIPQQPDSFLVARCKCYFEASNGERDRYYTSFRMDQSLASTFSSDHVCLWYDEFLCDSILEAVKESNASYQGTTYIPKISFEFFATSHHRRRSGKRRDRTKIKLEIKECGVWLIYNSEHQQGTKSKRFWDLLKA